MKALKFILIYLLLFGSTTLVAQQQSGVLRGLAVNVTNGETIPFANVIVKDTDNRIVAGGTSNIDGLFIISPIDEGTYTVEATYLGFTTEIYKDVKIENGKTKTISILFTEEMTTLEECVVMAKQPLIDKAGCRRTFTTEDIYWISCYGLRCHVQDTSGAVLPSDSISMYPNPSSGELNIQSPDNLNFITVTNMNGQTVAEIAMDNPTQISANFQHLPPATYVVHFIKGGQRVSKLWILAH